MFGYVKLCYGIGCYIRHIVSLEIVSSVLLDFPSNGSVFRAIVIFMLAAEAYTHVEHGTSI